MDLDVIVTLMIKDEDVMSKRVSLNKEATLAELCKAISKSELGVDEEYQLLFFNTTDITFNYKKNVSLSNIGVKEGDVIVVKHSHLHLWYSLVNTYETFKTTLEEEMKKSLYEIAMMYINTLIDTKFLKAYDMWRDQFFKMHKHFASHYDRERAAIEKSANSYFRNMYSGKDIRITFSSRLDGTRRGVICYVHDRTNNDTSKYFIKTHHGGGARDSHTREDLDVKELYVYTLLQRLGVGAEIHLIPNAQRSKWILYIGSREIVGFQTVNEIEIRNVDLSPYVTPVIQMLTLYTVLNICDHHLLNMGLNEHKLPYIVDFILLNRDIIDVKRDFYNKVRGAAELNKVLALCDDNVRIKTAKEFLESVNFVTAVDEALVEFLGDYQRRFDQYDLALLTESKTDDLQRYVEKIKENANKFSQS